ncbi:MAG: hypothetical protein ACI9EW_002392, partial [Cellvibrionaceae bacterium]
EAYKDTDKTAQILKKTLDVLRQEKPLKEIKQTCESVLDKAGLFEDCLDSLPEQDPMSQKAADAKASINQDGWRAEVLDGFNSHQTQASKIMTQIEEDLSNFTKPLRFLKKAVSDLERQIGEHERSKEKLFGRELPFPTRQLKTAKSRLKDCLDIDPFDSDVVEARQYIRTVEKRVINHG